MNFLGVNFGNLFRARPLASSTTVDKPTIATDLSTSTIAGNLLPAARARCVACLKFAQPAAFVVGGAGLGYFGGNMVVKELPKIRDAVVDAGRSLSNRSLPSKGSLKIIGKSLVGALCVGVGLVAICKNMPRIRAS